MAPAPVGQTLRTEREVTPNRLGAVFLRLNRPRLHPYSGRNPQETLLEINVLASEGTELADPDPGLEEDLQDRVIPRVGTGQGQGFHVLIGSKRGAAAAFCLRDSNADLAEERDDSATASRLSPRLP